MSLYDLAQSGMSAQRIRINVIANNLANVNTTRTEEGTPYRRRVPLFMAVEEPGSFQKALRDAVDAKGGVKVTEIIEDRSDNAFTQIYDPHHPDADENGILLKPNINPIMEMVNLMAAGRAFESNVMVFNTARQMNRKAMEIGSV